MLGHALVALLLGISSVLAGPHSAINRPQRGCGTHITAEQLAVANKHFKTIKDSVGDIELPFGTTFDVFWHVIAANRTHEGGWIPARQLADQMIVLNEDYIPSGISFNLVNVEYILNPEWFNNADLLPDGSDETEQAKEMKRSLRKGGADALNLYSVGFSNSWLLGYTTFPWEYSSFPDLDGVVFAYYSVPGGGHPPYSEGRTLTHEVGHWAGLFHTFQGGCSEPNDMVADTAPVKEPNYGCPADGFDSCPGDGPDPIHNYMDYVDDACMNNFTKGQTVRMKEQLGAFRKRKGL